MSDVSTNPIEVPLDPYLSSMPSYVLDLRFQSHRNELLQRFIDKFERAGAEIVSQTCPDGDGGKGIVLRALSRVGVTIEVTMLTMPNGSPWSMLSIDGDRRATGDRVDEWIWDGDFSVVSADLGQALIKDADRYVECIGDI